MQKRNTKTEFLGLLLFLVAAGLLLTNGFVPRIAAQDTQVNVYEKVAPIGDVLARIMEEYVGEPDVDKVVEGALAGMMSTLDQHSSYIPERALTRMREDTKGEIEGIGVSIRPDDDENIEIVETVEGSPAEKAGFLSGDLIIKVDNVPVEDIWTEGLEIGERLTEVVEKIKGPRGSEVTVTVKRMTDEGENELDFTVNRARVPLPSLVETRMLENNITYVRISDFKDTTADDLRLALREKLAEGAKGLILDLRWNPGGLLTASKEVCEVFLPRRSLVTYTQGRKSENGSPNGDDMRLYTEKRPEVPEDFPVIILVNGDTASSSEIVTGAMQFYERAIILGQKTFGKGSVQTIIPLLPERTAALRLTTALYYTPADVTINHQGILPDVEIAMTEEENSLLYQQLRLSYQDDPKKKNEQNHGSITRDELIIYPPEPNSEQAELIKEVGEAFDERAAELLTQYYEQWSKIESTTEDIQLQRAVEILNEDPVWDNLIAKYHRDVHDTQVAADDGFRAESPLDAFLGIDRKEVLPEENDSEVEEIIEEVIEEAPEVAPVP